MSTNNYLKYIELMKPKVVLLMLTTMWVGMFLAPGVKNIENIFFVAVGFFLIAGAGGCLNQIFDHKVDANMSRTVKRPLATGEINIRDAIIFSILLYVIGFYLVNKYGNLISAFISLTCSFGYGFFYTLYLKYATPQNISIGGLYGAVPPLIGWAAITNNIDPNALLLVGIIFTWTPVHFWALALDKKNDYEKNNIPMLPVTHGEKITIYSIFSYNVLLLVFCILPYLTGLFSVKYFYFSFVLNIFYLLLNFNLFFNVKKFSKKSFIFSIIYLYLLFFIMILDRIWSSAV